MSDFGFVPAWPDELKELNRKYYWAQQRVRNLEAYIERVDPDDFYVTMTDLEQAQKNLYRIAEAFRKASVAWDAEHGLLTTGKATQA